MRQRGLAITLRLFLVCALAAARELPATDHDILGYRLKVVERSLPTHLRVLDVYGKERQSLTSIVGDPIANGATITVVANGATPSQQTLLLPPGLRGQGRLSGWRAVRNGFNYADRRGLRGPVKKALIRRSGGGGFVVKALVKANPPPSYLPPQDIVVAPPAPGTDGGMIFEILGGGDRYCVNLGGAAGGTVDNTDLSYADTFRVRKATAEVGCPVPAAPVTCGALFTLWGTEGTGPGEFNRPNGLAVGPGGEVYVSDNSPRIQKFDAAGTFLMEWGPAYGHLAVAPGGDILTASSDRIGRYDSMGTLITAWGSQGTGDGQFTRINAIAVDGAGNVYATDQFNHRVQKFDGAGTFLTKWGSEGTGDGQFQHPDGIAVDGSGSVYVAELLANRIQKFDSTGVFLAKWNSPGSSALAVDGAGNVYVSDFSTITKYDPTGTQLALLQYDIFSDFSGGIAVTPSGHILVPDNNKDRVLTFSFP